MATASMARQRRNSFPVSRPEKKDLAHLFFEREVEAQQAILLDDPHQVNQLAETVLHARRSPVASVSPSKKDKERELDAKLQWRKHVVDTYGVEFVKEGCPQSSPEKTPESLGSGTPCSPGQVLSTPEELPLAKAPLPEEVAPCTISANELAACTSAASLAGDIEDIDEADLSALDYAEQKAVRAAMEVLARVRAAKVAQSVMKQKRFLEQRLRQDQNCEVNPEEDPGWSQGGCYREESPEVALDRRATSAPCAQWTPELERGQVRGAVMPRKRRDSRGAPHTQLSKSGGRDSRGEPIKPPKKRVSFGKSEEVTIDHGDGKDSDGGDVGKDESSLGKRLARNRRISRGPSGRPIDLDTDSDDNTEKQQEGCQDKPESPKQNALARWWRRATAANTPSQPVAEVAEDDGDDASWLLSAY